MKAFARLDVFHRHPEFQCFNHWCRLSSHGVCWVQHKHLTQGSLEPKYLIQSVKDRLWFLCACIHLFMHLTTTTITWEGNLLCFFCRCCFGWVSPWLQPRSLMIHASACSVTKLVMGLLMDLQGKGSSNLIQCGSRADSSLNVVWMQCDRGGHSLSCEHGAGSCWTLV
jgi:hypothetical protein